MLPGLPSGAGAGIGAGARPGAGACLPTVWAGRTLGRPVNKQAQTTSCERLCSSLSCRHCLVLNPQRRCWAGAQHLHSILLSEQAADLEEILWQRNHFLLPSLPCPALPCPTLPRSYTTSFTSFPLPQQSPPCVSVVAALAFSPRRPTPPSPSSQRWARASASHPHSSWGSSWARSPSGAR